MIKLSPRCYNLGFIPPFCRNPFWVAKDNSSYFCKLPLDFHEHGHGYGHGEDGHSGHPQVDVHSEFHLRWVPQWQRATVRWPLILGIHCHWMNIDECRWVNKDLLSLQDSKDVDSKPFILNHWISCSTAWAEGEQLPSPTCDEMRQHWSDFPDDSQRFTKVATVPQCHGATVHSFHSFHVFLAIRGSENPRDQQPGFRFRVRRVRFDVPWILLPLSLNYNGMGILLRWTWRIILYSLQAVQDHWDSWWYRVQLCSARDSDEGGRVKDGSHRLGIWGCNSIPASISINYPRYDIWASKINRS